MLDGKQIREVTPEGIVYLDESGEEKFIDFAACYENYVKHRTTPEYWERQKRGNHLSDADWEDYVERVKRWKEVGTRDISRLYIEFYCEPSTRIEFANEDEFQMVRNAITRGRWKTFDLT